MHFSLILKSAVFQRPQALQQVQGGLSDSVLAGGVVPVVPPSGRGTQHAAG